jgi:hypothetical protein
MNGIHRAYRHWMHDYLAWKYFYMGVFRPKINVYVSPPQKKALPGGFCVSLDRLTPKVDKPT